MNKIRSLLGLKPKYKLKTKSYKKFHEQQVAIQPADDLKGEVVIVNRPQTNYFAHLLAYKFSQYGIRSIITPFDIPSNKRPKIIYCPQIYESLDDKYIGFQTEQTSYDRFFKPEHMERLSKASTLLDYAEDNISFLKKKLPGMAFHHLPVTICHDYLSHLVKNNLLNHNEILDDQDRPYDIVFYGDPRPERREKYLNEIQKHFKVKIICGAFGMDVVRELMKAKIVLNIHVFDDAILEIGRIYEALSLKCHVISETATDQNRHAALNNIVDFCPVGDIQSMIKAIDVALTDHDKREQSLRNLSKASLNKTLNHNFNTFVKTLFDL